MIEIDLMEIRARSPRSSNRAFIRRADMTARRVLFKAEFGNIAPDRERILPERALFIANRLPGQDRGRSWSR
ncbi:hypothetical protein [Undibacter mobilis]|uniref:hypothetical protein n=1 Tax=Undibacter mobilis TaxID=2292256 RepID=UPI0011C030C7|nr:hypothetical protein [Undibacter mobilis]